MITINFTVDERMMASTNILLKSLSAFLLKSCEQIKADSSLSSLIETVASADITATKQGFSPAKTKIHSSFIHPIKWTPERVDALSVARAAGKSWTDILCIVNNLPGEKITSPGACFAQYKKMVKAEKPDEAPVSLEIEPVATQSAWQTVPEQCKPEEQQSVGLSLSANPGKAKKLIRAYRAEIEQWAAVRGLYNGVGATLDLDKVNAKREANGMAPFELIKGR